MPPGVDVMTRRGTSYEPAPPTTTPYDARQHPQHDVMHTGRPGDQLVRRPRAPGRREGHTLPTMSVPQGPPPPPAHQPAGWIRLTVQGNALTSNMVTPSVRLNGYPVQGAYGASVHPVPPGPWHVDVHCQWLRQYGQAALDVQVADGQTVDVFYAPPWHQFASGRIGLEPQPRPGLGLFLVLMAVVVVVVVVGIAVSLL